ncbi:uncharacterized protein LOC135471373 [Liolophura sinensis]|uniref:uncharacterized protein LOC135471373 n=1 Tax=Liolophura sinensis TaxID=3198878 RepID=UPI003159807C
MCKNGGECRYLYGSLVNTCECPQEFEGPQCQFPKAHISSECLVLGCSQTCVKESEDRYACGCEDGYRLGMDNTTCVEEGRLRVVVGVLIHSKNNSQTAIPREEVNSQDFLTSLKTKVSEACDHWGSGVCDISRLDVSSFRNTTGGYLLEFYFYCEKSDIQKVENGIRILVSGGSISPFVINQQYLEIRTEPALHLLDVQNYDKRPAIQGQLLTLVCTARGSEFLNFRWFKDGALVRTDLANRNAWEQRVPATVHETQLDILNIGKRHTTR